MLTGSFFAEKSSIRKLVLFEMVAIVDQFQNVQSFERVVELYISCFSHDFRQNSVRNAAEESSESAEVNSGWEEKVIEIKKDFEKNMQLMKSVRSNKGKSKNRFVQIQGFLKI